MVSLGIVDTAEVFAFRLAASSNRKCGIPLMPKGSSLAKTLPDNTGKSIDKGKKLVMQRRAAAGGKWPL